MSRNISNRSVIGVFGLLTILFTVLKLTGYAKWPWLVVLSPVWIPISVELISALLFHSVED